MGFIREPKGVTFTVGERRMTKADEKAFSSYFKKLKTQRSGKKVTKTNTKLVLAGK